MSALASSAGESVAAAGSNSNEVPPADDNIYVEPLVHLEKIKVVTNEEDEDILFQKRAKLYMFVKEDVYGGEQRQNYWKERGLGDIKVLSHRETGKCRVLMRQEKTLKICANFYPQVSAPLAKNTSAKSWLFHAFDPLDTSGDGDEDTEGSASPELKQYAVKFKTQEFADEFKTQFEVAQKKNEENTGNSPAKAKASNDVDNGAEASGGADDEAAALDALIAKRNAREKVRRSSVAALSALKDSDYDSDEEDIDEGNEKEIREKYHMADTKADGSVDKLASKLEKATVSE